MRSFFLTIVAIVATLNLAAWFFTDRLASAGSGDTWPHVLLAGFFLLQFAGILSLFASMLWLKREPGTGPDRPLHMLVLVWNPLFCLPAVLLSAGAYAFVAFEGIDAESVRIFAMVAAFFWPVAALLATVVAHVQLGRFVVRKLTLDFADLPADLLGFKIAHVSDLHVGALTRGAVLSKVTETVNALGADLVVITGDIINMSLAALPEAVSTITGMRAKHGVYVVEGNHDLIADARRFEEGVRAAGVNLLSNENVVLRVGASRLAIIGLRWGEGHGSRESKVADATGIRRLAGLASSADFSVALAHHPDAFDATSAAGIPLTFAGHTHGGQLMLTRRFGFGSWLYRYWSGLYKDGANRLLVSNGTGNWFPLRIGAPAEITLVTLRSEG